MEADAAANADAMASAWEEECEVMEGETACYMEDGYGYLAFTGITPADYPLDAWRAGGEGEVHFEVDYDADGSITACRLLESSGSASLDNATCDLVTSRGTIGFDTDSPVAGTVTGYHTWEKREPTWDVFSVSVAFTVGADGQMRDCEVLNSSGNMPEDMKSDFERNPCPSSGYQPPYRDDNGVPIERRIQLTLSVDEIPLSAD